MHWYSCGSLAARVLDFFGCRIVSLPLISSISASGRVGVTILCAGPHQTRANSRISVWMLCAGWLSGILEVENRSRVGYS